MGRGRGLAGGLAGLSKPAAGRERLRSFLEGREDWEDWQETGGREDWEDLEDWGDWQETYLESCLPPRSLGLAAATSKLIPESTLGRLDNPTLELPAAAEEEEELEEARSLRAVADRERGPAEAPPWRGLGLLLVRQGSRLGALSPTTFLLLSRGLRKPLGRAAGSLPPHCCSLLSLSSSSSSWPRPGQEDRLASSVQLSPALW